MSSSRMAQQPPRSSSASSNHNGITFYMTPEEAEHIRNTFKRRLRKCQDLAGQPRPCSDSNLLANEVAKVALLSDFAAVSMSERTDDKNRSNAMVVFPIGPHYPPCTIPLQELKPIKLSDLRVETHHRGQVLTLRRESPVVKLKSYSWTVAKEDVSGDMVRLMVHLHKSKYHEDFLESGSWLTLKEPYFTFNGQDEPTLWVDHPSDLLVGGSNPSDDNAGLADKKPDETVSPPPVSSGEMAREFKESGNKALKNQDFPSSYANYSGGLKLVAKRETKNDIAYDLFRNRAYVNLVLRRLDEAKSDAMTSVTNLEDPKHRALDSKAYFRAGCAAYALGDYQEAKTFFEDQHRMTPNDKSAADGLRKTKLRLNEQATGEYDFKKIKAGLSKAHPRVDAATFLGNIEVRESPGRGRGLFATCDLDSNDIVICEKAFCVVWDHEDDAWTSMTYDFRDDRIRGFPAGLLKEVVQKLLNNPSQIEKVMDLYGDYQGIGKQLIMGDGSPVVDTFQVHDIIARNAFGPGSVASRDHDGDKDVTNASAGLWIWSAYINHSCLPNVKAEFVGDLMVLRATRPIRRGEEIMHRYDQSNDYDARNTALNTTWGFSCECLLCKAERSDDPEVREKRRELESKANAFLQREDPASAKRLSISMAKRLVRSIEDTYDNERYKNLPRTALQQLEKWLAAAGQWSTSSASSRKA